MLELLYHGMEWITYQFHMESGWYGPNYEEEFQDEEDFQNIVELVKKLECYFIIWIYDNYIQQTKYDGICRYENAGMDSSR